MVNTNVLGGYDNVTFPAGWTDQGTVSPGINTSLESYSGPSSTLFDPPNGNGYGAWSIIPEDAINPTTNHGGAATSMGTLTRVFVPANFTCGHIDWVTGSTAVVAFTGMALAIYSGASFATGPLAWTGQLTTQTTTSTLYSSAWNGTSSPASVTLTGGQVYWIYSTITLGASGVYTMACSAGASAASMNPNLTASATSANNSMTLSPAPVLYTAVGASSTLTPQTSWANAASKFWFGLRA